MMLNILWYEMFMLNILIHYCLSFYVIMLYY